MKVFIFTHVQNWSEIAVKDIFNDHGTMLTKSSL